MLTKTIIGPSILISLMLCFALAFPIATQAASGTLDDIAPTAFGKKPSFAGSADAKEVRVQIKNDDGKTVFTSRKTKVKDGEWKVRVTKKLKVGEYQVRLFAGTGSKQEELDWDTLSITSKSSGGSSKSKVSVSSLPLLSGGTATMGASVPVAYIRVSNPGTTVASITGFTLQENGTAPDSVVTAFATNDDKGGSRATYAKSFSKGKVLVPLSADVAPGQTRIFTIKAQLQSAPSKAVGTQLKIDLASVETKGSVNGTLPVRGTTWTLGF